MSVPLAQQILTIADNGSGLPRVTTAAAHGLVSGSVIISGTNLHNGTFTISVINATTFDLTSGEFLGADSGGRWDPV